MQPMSNRYAEMTKDELIEELERVDELERQRRERARRRLAWLKPEAVISELAIEDAVKRLLQTRS